MDTWMILVVAAVVMIAAPIAWLAVGKIQSEALKRGFAVEYALAMKTAGSRSRAEAHQVPRTCLTPVPGRALVGYPAWRGPTPPRMIGNLDWQDAVNAAICQPRPRAGWPKPAPRNPAPKK